MRPISTSHYCAFQPGHISQRQGWNNVAAHNIARKCAQIYPHLLYRSQYTPTSECFCRLLDSLIDFRRIRQPFPTAECCIVKLLQKYGRPVRRTAYTETFGAQRQREHKQIQTGRASVPSPQLGHKYELHPSESDIYEKFLPTTFGVRTFRKFGWFADVILLGATIERCW